MKQRVRLGSNFWRLVGLATMLVGLGAVLQWRHARDLEQSQITQEAAVLIPSQFKTWRGLTSDRWQAVQWSGAASELLYLDGPRYGDGMFWVAWARSTGGDYFRLTYHYDGKHFVPNESPVPMSRQQAIAALVEAGQEAVLDRLGLLRKPTDRDRLL